MLTADWREKRHHHIKNARAFDSTGFLTSDVSLYIWVSMAKAKQQTTPGVRRRRRGAGG
jgi:hypothetical protein